MNAVSNSESNFAEENVAGSDTETISEEFPEYYEPISYDSNDEEDSSDQNSDNDHEANFHCLVNGGVSALTLENGTNHLDPSNEEEGEDDEEEERMREAMRRAFREDESRRRAPLTPDTPENTTRVMEAMRGISLGGLVPDWADQIPEDQWMDRLATIRQPPSSTAS